MFVLQVAATVLPAAVFTDLKAVAALVGYLVLIGAAMQQYWGYTIGVKVYTALSGSSSKPSEKKE